MSAKDNVPGPGRRRIYLMRHGHVDYFAREVVESRDPTRVPLTDTGRAQAKAAGEALAAVTFDRAFFSGLPRTRETAEVVLAENPAAPPLEAEFGLEELKSGKFLTETREQVFARLAFAFSEAAEPGATFLPDGEAFADAYTRTTEALRGLLTQGGWKTALVVAHEGVNRLLLGWACGAGLQAVAAFEQDLGCVNVLDFDMVRSSSSEGLEIERIIIKTVNATPYDYLKHGMPRTSLEHLFDLDMTPGE